MRLFEKYGKNRNDSFLKTVVKTPMYNMLKSSHFSFVQDLFQCFAVVANVCIVYFIFLVAVHFLGDFLAL